MRRTSNRDNHPYVKPVQRVEVPQSHPKWKWILVVVLLALGVTLIAVAAVEMLSQDPGWQSIQVESAEENCGGEFTFQYYLGRAGVSAGVELKQIKELYAETMVQAYRLFHESKRFAELHNVCYLNSHINEVVEVDPVLYAAFETLQDSRMLYLAPVYMDYTTLFLSTGDDTASMIDPYLDQDSADFFAQIAAFANDPEMIDLELLGNNQVRLHVSQEYQAYLATMEIETYIDFYWLKNAFITDYLADTMMANGYTKGAISSYDGFFRILDSGDTEYSVNLYDRVDQDVYPAAVAQLQGQHAVVSLRNYPLHTLDVARYYCYANGQIRSWYVDAADGLCKTSINDLMGYSQEQNCAEIVLQLLPVFIADTFDEDLLGQKDVQYIYSKDHTLYTNDSDLSVTQVYQQEGIHYQVVS